MYSGTAAVSSSIHPRPLNFAPSAPSAANQSNKPDFTATNTYNPHVFGAQSPQSRQSDPLPAGSTLPPIADVQMAETAQKSSNQVHYAVPHVGVANPNQWSSDNRHGASQPGVDEMQAWQHYFRQQQLSSFYGPSIISPHEQAIQQANLAARMGQFQIPYGMYSAPPFHSSHTSTAGLNSRPTSLDFSDSVPQTGYGLATNFTPSGQIAYHRQPVPVLPQHQALHPTGNSQTGPAYLGANVTSARQQSAVPAMPPHSNGSKSRKESQESTPNRSRARRTAHARSKPAPDSEDDDAGGALEFSDGGGDDDDDEGARRRRKRQSWAELAPSLEPVAGAPTIDKVLDDRLDAPTDPFGQERRLFYVKWLGRAHIYNTWDTYENLRGFKGTKKLENNIKNMNKIAELKLEATPEDIEAFEVGRELEREQVEQHTKIDRVVSSRTTQTGETQYLIKWCKLQYNEATWEPAERVQPFEFPLRKFLFREQQAPLCARYYQRASRSHSTHRDLKQLNTTRPSFLTGDLRDYQVQGVNWLIYSWVNHTNCILAYVCLTSVYL
jgi:hypothetical protein